MGFTVVNTRNSVSLTSFCEKQLIGFESSSSETNFTYTTINCHMGGKSTFQFATQSLFVKDKSSGIFTHGKLVALIRANSKIRLIGKMCSSIFAA